MNPLREALETKTFSYVVELVASRLTREARLLEVATGLAQIPGLVSRKHHELCRWSHRA